MDMILLMEVKRISTKYDGKNFETIKEEIREYCLNVLNDGTKYFLDEIHSSQKLSEEEKKEYSNKFVSKFLKAFDTSGDKPKLKRGFSFKLVDIYKNSQGSPFVTNDATYNLYSYYSKYDHLSHWTSLSSHINFEDRKGKLDLSIILMVFYLRDLLSVAFDFAENYKMLSPYIEELNEFLNTNYNRKD